VAFTLKIETKRIFGKKLLDFEKIIQDCGLKYGTDNDFYILEEGKLSKNTILYNPNKIGRGIFMDLTKVNEGIIEIRYNIPSTKTEILDFINAVESIERQLKKTEIYCYEEECKYTVIKLRDSVDRMVAFSLSKLNEFCSNKEYYSHIFTLAKWPIVLGEEKKIFAKCEDLNEFETFIHKKQALDVYYAKPSFMCKDDGIIGAFYVLTEECESIFPIKADGFLNLSEVKIEVGYIQFYIYSEKKMEEGLYKYDKFIAYIMNKGFEKYDDTHIIIPSLTKDEIRNMITEL